MKIIALILSFLLASPGWATTYCVRQDGSASQVNATDCANSASSMSAATFNASSFSAGDTIYFSDRGGDITTNITIPSSGSDSNNRIIYRGEPGNIPNIASDGGITVGTSGGAGKSYIDLVDLKVDRATAESCFLFQGSSIDVRTYNIQALNAANQCLQHLDDGSYTHNNVTATGGADEGLSSHNNCTIIVNGGNISGRSGMNWVLSPTYEIYDATITSTNGSYFAIEPPSGAVTYHMKFHRCTIVEASGKSNRGTDWNAAGTVEYINCILKNLTTGDYELLFRSSASFVGKIFNCLFVGSTPSGAVISNADADSEYKNNIFYNTGKSFSGSTGTIDSNAFYNAGAGQGTNKITSDPLLRDPANGKFQPLHGSPLIGVGADLSGTFTTDFDNKARHTWTIGPYAYRPIQPMVVK